MARMAVVGAISMVGASVRGQTTGPAPLPVPALSQQAAAQEEIHKLMAADFAKTAISDRAALAHSLLSQAEGIQGDSATRYVLLVDSAEVAAMAGDAATAITAIDELGRSYTVGTLLLRRDALVQAHAAAQGAAENRTVMSLALETADRAAAADAFDVVRQLAKVAEGAANDTREVKTVASIQEHLADLRGLADEFDAVRAAFVRLDKNPADAEAHLAVGRFYALHKGQWALGLPQLATGSDAELRQLAGQELVHPADGVEQVQLGDAWWAYGEKSGGLTKHMAQAHAADWYRAAQQNLAGTTLARIQTRLAESPVSTPAAAGAVHGGQSLDLLALVDADKDAVQGQWSKSPAGLVCGSGAYAALELPYQPAEEYDLHVAFMRTQGKGEIAVLLSSHGRVFDFAVDVKGEARFERVNGKIAKDNPTTTPIAISNNQPYALTIEVRKDHVRALLADKPIAEWKTDYKDLSHYALWKSKDDSLCGVGANNAGVTFQSITVTEVSGTGKPMR